MPQIVQVEHVITRAPKVMQLHTGKSDPTHRYRVSILNDLALLRILEVATAAEGRYRIWT
jgi:hypothetical protein